MKRWMLVYLALMLVFASTPCFPQIVDLNRAAITLADMADDSVDSNKIVDASISSDDLPDVIRLLELWAKSAAGILIKTSAGTTIAEFNDSGYVSLDTLAINDYIRMGTAAGLYISNSAGDTVIDFDDNGTINLTTIRALDGSGVIYTTTGDVLNATFNNVTTEPSGLPDATFYGQVILDPAADATDLFQVLDADGGDPVLNVDTTNEGVGIGTIPDRTFHVMVSDASLAPKSLNTEIVFEKNDNLLLELMTPNDKYGAFLFTDGDFAGGVIYDHGTVFSGTSGLHFRSGGSFDRMVIDTSGNVGIGTAPTSHILSVNGAITASDTIHIKMSPTSIPDDSTLFFSLPLGVPTITGMATDGDISAFTWTTDDAVELNGATFKVAKIGALSAAGVIISTSAGSAIATFTNAGNTNIAGALTLTPSAAQSIAAGVTVSSTGAGFARVFGEGGAVTSTADPSVTAGVSDGQIIYIQGTVNAAALTLQDEDNNNGSTLELAGGINFALGLGDILVLAWNSGESKWFEISRSNN